MWQIFTTVKCRISSRLIRYENHKNRLRLAKVIVKNKMSRFLWFSVYMQVSSLAAVSTWLKEYSARQRFQPKVLRDTQSRVGSSWKSLTCSRYTDKLCIIETLNRFDHSDQFLFSVSNRFSIPTLLYVVCLWGIFRWRGGVTVRHLGLRSVDRRFKSCRGNAV